MPLVINETFYSIQGEGLHTGIPMYFIRLQGCEVGCYFCDTKESWRKSFTTITPNSSSVQPWLVEDEGLLIKEALNYKNLLWVCITGGEPYEQDISDLLMSIEENSLMSHIETSGTVTIGDTDPDWITLSPKDLFSKKKTLEYFKEESSEIKCVVTKDSDFDYYVDNYYRYCDIDKPLIFQPVDNSVNLIQNVIDRITSKELEFARIMLQQHKVLMLR